jgi:hypothetical protein
MPTTKAIHELIGMTPEEVYGPDMSELLAAEQEAMASGHCDETYEPMCDLCHERPRQVNDRFCGFCGPEIVADLLEQ